MKHYGEDYDKYADVYRSWKKVLLTGLPVNLEAALSCAGLTNDGDGAKAVLEITNFCNSISLRERRTENQCVMLTRMLTFEDENGCRYSAIMVPTTVGEEYDIDNGSWSKKVGTGVIGILTAHSPERVDWDAELILVPNSDEAGMCYRKDIDGTWIFTNTFASSYVCTDCPLLKSKSCINGLDTIRDWCQAKRFKDPVQVGRMLVNMGNDNVIVLALSLGLSFEWTLDVYSNAAYQIARDMGFPYPDADDIVKQVLSAKREFWWNGDTAEHAARAIVQYLGLL